MATNDGGPLMGATGGATMRDYFAAIAPPPDLQMIATVADWPAGLPEGEPRWYRDEGERPDSMHKRWDETTGEARVLILTAFRFRWADAMLDARVPPAAGEGETSR